MEFVISHMVKSYGSKQVLKDCDFVFEEDRIYGLLGRNGSGKTTFFNCINSDIDINSGAFYFRSGKDTHEQIPVQSEDIGYVVSTPTVPEFMAAILAVLTAAFIFFMRLIVSKKSPKTWRVKA